MPALKPGDMVRVERKVRHPLWMGSMDRFVGNGKAYRVVRAPTARNVFVETGGPGDGWWFPLAALEPALFGNEED